jgi:hypothetical protein
MAEGGREAGIRSFRDGKIDFHTYAVIEEDNQCRPIATRLSDNFIAGSASAPERSEGTTRYTRDCHGLHPRNDFVGLPRSRLSPATTN